MTEQCWLARFSERPCDGRLRAVHLVPKQRLKRAGADPWDERSYVAACGGLTGLGGHHGELDTPGCRPRLVIPAEALPGPLVELCEEVGLRPYLEATYGLGTEGVA